MESALLVAVREAEPIVSRWRMQFDRSAAAGIPAHVTLLYPFKPPDVIDQLLVNELTKFFNDWTPIVTEFMRTSRFGSEVLWLAPEPSEAYRSMGVALIDRYPECRPYGGAFAEMVPHLTVAHASQGGDLDEIDRAVSAQLPISTRVEEVWLMEQGADERWRKRAAFLLGG